MRRSLPVRSRSLASLGMTSVFAFAQHTVIGLLLLSTALSERAQAQDQSTLIIAVSEVAKATPVANAEVFLPELRRRARTGQAGEAKLTGIPRGVYEVHVRRLGFAEAAILVPLDRDSVTITVMLRPSAAELDTVHVTESAIVAQRHREFEQRRKR